MLKRENLKMDFSLWFFCFTLQILKVLHFIYSPYFKIREMFWFLKSCLVKDSHDCHLILWRIHFLSFFCSSFYWKTVWILFLSRIAQSCLILRSPLLQYHLSSTWRCTLTTLRHHSSRRVVVQLCVWDKGEVVPARSSAAAPRTPS